MIKSRKKIMIFCLIALMIFGVSSTALAEDIIIPTSVTEGIVFDSFDIQPGEKYRFLNTGEDEADVFMGSQNIVDYKIEFYNEEGVLIDEMLVSMDGFGGPSFSSKESIIVSVEKDSPNPLTIDSYGKSIKIEKLTSEQVTTLNQSTIRLNRWEQFDSSHGVYYTIKNNTNMIDTNNFALVLFMNDGGKYGFISEIHFFEEIVLAPSEEYNDLFYSQFYAPSVLNNKIKAVIVKFENVDKLEKMKKSAPPNNLVNNAYDIKTSIDDGEKGKQWFKDNFNIDIK